MPERMSDRMSKYMPERMSNTVEGQYSSLCTLYIYIYTLSSPAESFVRVGTCRTKVACMVFMGKSTGNHGTKYALRLSRGEQALRNRFFPMTQSHPQEKPKFVGILLGFYGG